ncbi:MAG: hypothetical protein LBT36_02440 [Oscillospiraceae bacterium]|jgi:vacuolar-type H+-ATPase subunit H|nr:hypothetical protein [Oscillospiraceae bacterium]
MSLEAIEQITAAEDAAKRRIAEAQAEAKRSAEEAERVGRESVESSLRQAEDDVRAMKHELDLKAAESARELVDKTANRRAALRAHAEARLEQAGAIIVERIVSG